MMALGGRISSQSGPQEPAELTFIATSAGSHTREDRDAMHGIVYTDRGLVEGHYGESRSLCKAGKGKGDNPYPTALPAAPRAAVPRSRHDL